MGNQQFHLVIRYKKGIFNKFVNMLSRPIISASTLLKNDSIVHESYIEQYAHDIDFQDVYVVEWMESSWRKRLSHA